MTRRTVGNSGCGAQGVERHAKIRICLLNLLWSAPAEDQLAPQASSWTTPEPINNWSLMTLREKLVKIGTKVVRHGRYVAFQMAEVAIPG